MHVSRATTRGTVNPTLGQQQQQTMRVGVLVAEQIRRQHPNIGDVKVDVGAVMSETSGVLRLPFTATGVANNRDITAQGEVEIRRASGTIGTPRITSLNETPRNNSGGWRGILHRVVDRASDFVADTARGYYTRYSAQLQELGDDLVNLRFGEVILDVAETSANLAFDVFVPGSVVIRAAMTARD